MNADNQSTPQQNAVTVATGKPQVAATTTMQHPVLPSGATLIERIVLPTVFTIVTSTVKNAGHAAELKEYMLAVRDAINGAYPGE